MSFSSEEDLSCPICQDVFRDPVVLSCSHSFCGACLRTWWNGKAIRECPVCKRRSSRSEPPRNLALRNLCETFVLERSQRALAGLEGLCGLHGEKLKLFCLDHQQPACLICRDSKAHVNHKFRPVHEFAQEHRMELERSLRPLRDKLKVFQYVRENCEKTAEHIKIQAQNTERQIKNQFQRLRQFLEEEEEARLAALSEEEHRKSGLMREKMEALSGEISALSDIVTATQDKLEADDVSFLLGYKAAAKRVQQHPLLENPQPVAGALIDVAKHLGNLSFNIWSQMKEQVSYSPVILDPNTANPEFTLSEDLTAVSHGERQQVPENLERTDYHRSVRSREGFLSGTHTWDVEVGDNTAWFVGVAAESMQKKGRVKSGFWQIEYFNGKYNARTQGAPSCGLRVKKKLQRVRVHLDWSRGRLMFFDPDTGAHVQTFTHAFTDVLFPCFGTLHQLPLKILASRISVVRE